MNESPSVIADRIARYAKRLGYEVLGVYASTMSCSYYLWVSITKIKERFPCPCFSEFKIRISDHELPEEWLAKNGCPDFEVDDSNWFECVRWLAREAGTPLPESQKVCPVCKELLVQGQSRMTYHCHAGPGTFGEIVSAEYEWCPTCKKFNVPSGQFIADFAEEVSAGKYDFVLPQGVDPREPEDHKPVSKAKIA